MKFLIAACCIVATFPSVAASQTQVYGAVAPGVRHDTGAGTIEIGGGIQRGAYRGFAVALGSSAARRAAERRRSTRFCRGRRDWRNGARRSRSSGMS